MRHVLLAPLWLIVACGSSSESGLFAGSGGAGGGGQGASGGHATGGGAGTQTGGTGGAGGSAGAVGGSGGAAGAPLGGSSGQAGAPAGGTGGTPSGGAGGGSGGAPTGGTGGGAPGPVGNVSCGLPNNCNLASSYCCLYLSSQIPSFACQLDLVPCVAGTKIECDGHEDCGAGQVCCGQLTNSGGSLAYSSLSCANPGECTVAQSRVWVCGQTGVCPGGLVCKPSSLLPHGYDVCVQQ